MNHDAKFSGGIFGRRRTPSQTSINSGRLSVQSRNGSVSCPTSPRHTPKLLPPTPSTSNLNSILAPTSSNFHDPSDRRHHLHRSSSSASNYSNGNGSYNKQRSGYCTYTGKLRNFMRIFKLFFLINLIGGYPSAPASAHSSRVDLSNIGRPSTGSAIYLGRSSGASGSKLSLVSRSSSLSSPHSSPKHRARQ
jgi:hypothetical protein